MFDVVFRMVVLPALCVLAGVALVRETRLLARELLADLRSW